LIDVVVKSNKIIPTKNIMVFNGWNSWKYTRENKIPIINGKILATLVRISTTSKNTARDTRSLLLF